MSKWITDRNPTKEECGQYGKIFQTTVYASDPKNIPMQFVYETVRGKEIGRWKWNGKISPWEVVAWKNLDEPYIKEDET